MPAPRVISKWTAYCPCQRQCQRRKHLGTYKSEEDCKQAIIHHLVASAHHYMAEEEAAEIVNATVIEPWQDADSSDEEKPTAQTASASAPACEKPDGPPAGKRREASASERPSSNAPRPRRPRQESPRPRSPSPRRPRAESQRPHSSSASRHRLASEHTTELTATMAAVLQNAISIAATASAKAAPAFPPEPATASPASSSVLATPDQQHAWARVISTMVRSESALRAAAQMARQASDAFNESAVTVKTQIDTLTQLSNERML